MSMLINVHDTLSCMQVQLYCTVQLYLHMTYGGNCAHAQH
jgi:hypothetical protein